MNAFWLWKKDNFAVSYRIKEGENCGEKDTYESRRGKNYVKSKPLTGVLFDFLAGDA